MVVWSMAAVVTALGHVCGWSSVTPKVVFRDRIIAQDRTTDTRAHKVVPLWTVEIIRKRSFRVLQARCGLSFFSLVLLRV